MTNAEARQLKNKAQAAWEVVRAIGYHLAQVRESLKAAEQEAKRATRLANKAFDDIGR